MRTPVRFLAALGLLLGLVAATTLGAGAGNGEGTISTFTVTVYFCSPTNDALVGETEFFIDSAADLTDCVHSALADGVTVGLYDEDDTLLDSDVTSGGTTILEALVMGSLDYYLDENVNGEVSEEDDIDEEENATVNIVIYTDGGDLEITKLDDETGAPIAGAGFTLYDSVCGEVVAGEQLTDEEGVALFSDILAGDYCVIESTVPDGYLPLPSPISVEIVGGETESIEVANEAEEVTLPGTVVVVKYECVDDELAGETVFDFLLGTSVEGCSVAGGVEFALEDAEGTTVATEETDGAGVAAFSPVEPGDYRLVEGEAESELFSVGEDETVSVNVINYVEEQAGQVLVSAFTCTGDQADVVIEVSDPTVPEDFSAAAVECDPIDGLQVFIFLFGDEGSDPITGATDADGTILFAGIPPTDEETGPHLFRTIVFDSDFEADFDVDDDALTAITVLVFEPEPPTPTVEPTATATNTPPAPTATTAPAGPTSTAAAPTSTVSTLPGTGAGEPIRPDGSAAWLLVAVLGLAGLGTVGYALRRHAA